MQRKNIFFENRVAQSGHAALNTYRARNGFVLFTPRKTKNPTHLTQMSNIPSNSYNNLRFNKYTTYGTYRPQNTKKTIAKNFIFVYLVINIY